MKVLTFAAKMNLQRQTEQRAQGHSCLKACLCSRLIHSDKSTTTQTFQLLQILHGLEVRLRAEFIGNYMSFCIFAH